MERPNPFYRRSRISAKKFRQLLRLFALDLTATNAAELTGLTRKSVTTIFLKIRGRIAEECERRSPLSVDQVEVDESYFCARRVRGKRGRGAGGRTIVFGIYKRNGRVYTEVVPDCKKASLQAIIRGRVGLSATIHTDGLRSYDGIVHMGYKKHYRVRHDRDEFARGTAHINGIEGFWGMAKTRLVKFRGMSRSTFYLHLKECEFRFNHRAEDLYCLLLKITKPVITI